MRYLFYIAKIYSIPIIKPLMTVLEKTDHEYAFYVSEKVWINFPHEWSKNKVLQSLRAAKGFHPDFILCPGNFVDFRIPGVKVQLFHGLGIEKQSHYKIRHFFDIYLTSGPVVTKQFEKMQQKYKYFEVIETGWPKVDYILNYPTKGIKEKLEIPKDRRIILYAPTFSSKMESATDLLDVIPQIIKPDEFWLLKFHELMDRSIINEFKNIFSENTLIIQKADITPYMHVSDILISDTSSVIYEFMALGKPVITYKTIDRLDKGINILKPDELRRAIDTYIKNPSLHKERRNRHLSEVNPYLDGKISENIIKRLSKVKPSDFPRQGKPSNNFRKMQVIWHGIFKKGYLR